MDLRYNPPKASPSNPFLKTHPLKTYLTKPDPKSDPEKRTCPSLVSKCISSKRTPRIFAPKHIPDQRTRPNLIPKQTLSKHTPRIFAPKHIPDQRTRPNLIPKQTLSKRTSRNLTRTLSRRAFPPKPYLKIHLPKTYPTNRCPETHLPKTHPPTPCLKTHLPKTYPTNLCLKKHSRKTYPPNPCLKMHLPNTPQNLTKKAIPTNVPT